MLSTKPIPLLSANPLVADGPAKDLQTLSLLSGSNHLGNSPSGAPDGSVLQSTQQTGLSLVPPPASSREHTLCDETSQAASPLNPGVDLPDGQNATKSSQKQHSVTGANDNQNLPLWEVGDSLAGNDDAAKLSQQDIGNLAGSNGGREVDAPLLSIGNVPVGHRHAGLKNLFAAGANLLSQASDTGSKLVSAGASDHRLSAGFLSTQVTTSSGLTRHSADPTISATPVVLDGSGASTARIGVNSLFENGDDPDGFSDGLLRWLSGTWTGQIQNSHIVEAVAYSNNSTVQSQNLPDPNTAVERLMNVSAGVSGTERVSQLAVLVRGPLFVAGGQITEQLQPSTNHEQLTIALAVSEIITDSGAPPSTESTHRDLILSFGIPAEAAEFVPGQEVAAPDAGSGQHLVKNPANSTPGSPAWADEKQSLQTDGSLARPGFIQIDVATAGPVSSDAGMANTTASTAVYLANEQSSIWSIVTTYALVIIPRHRKPQPTILVVDPDDATRDALNVALVKEGYFVLPAGNVRDAWGTFRTPHAHIDLVLMDPHLPDVSGIHLCARLREISPTLPVMVCAGEVEPAEVAQLQQLGVRHYLRKPIAFEVLLQTVKTLLR